MPKQRVLVVEDTEAMAMLLHDILTDEGYEVILCPTMFEDMREVDQLQLTVIVSDYLTSQGNGGFTMLRRLKDHAATAHIPIVVCTAAVKEIDEIKPFLTTHQIDVVLKPFDIDTFVDTVRHAVTQHLSEGAGAPVAPKQAHV